MRELQHGFIQLGLPGIEDDAIVGATRLPERPCEWTCPTLAVDPCQLSFPFMSK